MDQTGSKKIVLEKVTKDFNLGYKDDQSLLSKIIHLFSGQQFKRKKSAVNNISFQIEEGEIVGIIGRNGGGKSTLLRLMAGIYSPDTGTVVAPSNILYINGFNHGIKPRLTMRENIYLVGAIMGLPRANIDNAFNDIVSFSGLFEYLDTKVYQFSSGMVSRLNFSMFIFFASLKKSDALLLDEVFGAGGDIDFKEKAEAKMTELIQSGVTVILVSHNLQDIKKHARRIIWMENGAIKEDGNIDYILQEYQRKIKL